MGHIIKKRTNFQKGNFRLAWCTLHSYLSIFGRYIPCNSYRYVHSPFYHTKKITEFERNYFFYVYKKTILNWLN